MFVLGLQGSPRKKGNTAYLLSHFLEETKKYGATTFRYDVSFKDIVPCKELIVCEKKGTCPIKDDMDSAVYSLIRAADLVILASPIFFYNITAQLKAVIDRCQVFWARRYKLGLKDPAALKKLGFVLSVAATSGQNLFEGVHLTTRYFFDAISAKDAGSLTYRNIENPGDMEKHPGFKKEVEDAVKTLMKPFLNRPRVLFVSEKDSCRSHMAAAFTQLLTQGEVAVSTSGIRESDAIDPEMEKVMAEKGLDVAFRKPQVLSEEIADRTYDKIIFLDEDIDKKTFDPAAKIIRWSVEKPSKKGLSALRQIRDGLAAKVRSEFQ